MNSGPRSFLIASLCVLLCLGVSASAGPTWTIQERGRPEMSDILKKAAAYCRKLKEASLYFVCQEEIRERQFEHNLHGQLYSGGKGGVLGLTHSWIYDYQLIRFGKVFYERRDLLEKDGKPDEVKNATLETQLFRHKFVVFGPVGLLSEDNQPNFRTEWVGEDTVFGEKAYVIDVRPGPSAPKDALFGRVWLKADDSSVLRIAWDQTSLGNFDEIRKNAVTLDATPLVKFVSEYGVEKNGLRFPSLYSIREDYLSLESRSLDTYSITTVDYKKYRFFTVDVTVKDSAQTKCLARGSLPSASRPCLIVVRRPTRLVMIFRARNQKDGLHAGRFS
jgi:hypothetical protein